MKLEELEKYNEIVVQVHDNPDADAVGSGYAIYRYFQKKKKSVRLVYGGRLAISKSNMRLLVSELQIPIEFVEELDNPELLITVDCQYGQGNVQRFEAQNVAVIDHHSTGKTSDDMAEIRTYLVSCATVCYNLLTEAGYNINEDRKVATALYYGLYMDSNQLSEISHPYDRDMMDFLQYDRNLISRLKHANLNIQDFETAGIAILRHNYVDKHRTAIINSRACDPNILGLIGDLTLQVDCMDICIVYSDYPNGYKLSVRSCLLEVAANELAGFLTAEIGDAGGRSEKAGGFINAEEFQKQYQGQSIEAYFFRRLDEYFEGYEVVHYEEGIRNKKDFRLYTKQAGIYGYVDLSELFAPGTSCKIRTLEGDVLMTSSEDLYIMIGYRGEVYPIERKVFERKYERTEGSFERKFEYPPSIINIDEKKSYELMTLAKQCKAVPGAKIYARPLEKPTKVFARWNYESYMSGNKGDMLCYSEGDEQDIYIIKKEIFENTYA